MVIGTRGGGGGDLPYVVGTYVGNRQKGHEINVGFEPSAVFVFNSEINVTQGMAFLAIIKGRSSTYSNAIVGQITSNGFRVADENDSIMNSTSYTYIYIAFK